MAKRIYNFTLPYEISSLYVHFGLQRLQSEGLFDKLPLDLRAKIETSAAVWEPVVISKEMCDAIDDDTWEKICKHLKWEFIPSQNLRSPA